MPDQKGGLQLLPETRRKVDIKVPGENRFLFLGAAVLAAVFVLFLGANFYTSFLTKKIASIDADLMTLEEQRDKKNEESLLLLNKQLSLISNLLNNHIFWSKGLSKIESLLQNQVQFETFSASTIDNKFSFKALAANYTVVARQIAAFLSDESIADVSLNNVNTLTNGKLEFNMKLDLDKTKFLKQPNAK